MSGAVDNYVNRIERSVASASSASSSLAAAAASEARPVAEAAHHQSTSSLSAAGEVELTERQNQCERESICRRYERLRVGFLKGRHINIQNE